MITNTHELSQKAYELRIEVVKMIYESDISSGHFGGSLSAAEIITALYWKIMRVDPSNPNWEDRDRLILGKGHSVPIVYAALAHKGYFDKSILKTYRESGSILQGHPDCLKTPGLDASSGSLGQGLSAALGIALAARYLKKPYHVYALLSDGELEEGMTWEALMAAGYYKTRNLTAIIDSNNMQCVGCVDSVMNIEPLTDKFKAFGWEYVVVNGHDIPSILSGFELRHQKTKPLAIIAKTTKGKGVSFMENSPDWHCAAINDTQYNQAVSELQNFI